MAVALGPGGLAGFGAGGIGGAAAGAIGAQGIVYTGLTAGFNVLANQAALSIVNNGFNIGDALDDLASSATVRSVLTTAVTAGAISNLNSGLLQDFPSGSFADRIVRATVESSASAVINSTVNGTSFEESLVSAIQNGIINATQGYAASSIKSLQENYILNKVLHAAAGCAVAAAADSGCADGAIGASVAEMVAQAMVGDRKVSEISDEEKEYIANISSSAAGAAASALGLDAIKASEVGLIAALNNALKYVEEKTEGPNVYNLTDEEALEVIKYFNNTDDITLEMVKNNPDLIEFANEAIYRVYESQNGLDMIERLFTRNSKRIISNIAKDGFMSIFEPDDPLDVFLRSGAITRAGIRSNIDFINELNRF